MLKFKHIILQIQKWKHFLKLSRNFKKGIDKYAKRRHNFVNRTEQNRTEQNRTEQNRTEQTLILRVFCALKQKIIHTVIDGYYSNRVSDTDNSRFCI